MHSLLAYIVQVNILLVIVYVGYYLLLRKLTFYSLNRGYFLIGLVFAFMYPFLDIKSLVRQHIEPVDEWMTYLPDFYMPQVEESVYTLEQAIYGSIAVVGLWFVIRLCIQLLSLWRIHRYSRKAIWKTYWYQDVLFPIVPFSFLNKIYLHKEQHQELELYDIFEHEDVHVKGLHSMDILMFEILLIVCWYNPFVWLMRRSVRQNLEYLTDQQVLNKGVDRQTYQYSLLHVSKQGASLGLSNRFNFKFLKKRIMMMNKKKSSKLELSKYAFLLPIFIFSAGAFTISKADSRISEVVEVAKGITLEYEGVETVVKDEDGSGSGVEDSIPNVEPRKDDRKSLLGTVKVRNEKKDTADTAQHPSVIVKVGRTETQPMYIIDGQVQTDGQAALKMLDHHEIASIDVLKGESAIALYGEKGKEGIVLVTLKDTVRENKENELRVWGVQAPEPLRNPGYVVDGVMVSKEAYVKIQERDKKTIVTLSKTEAENYFKAYNRSINLDAHDGVVMVTTK